MTLTLPHTRSRRKRRGPWSRGARSVSASGASYTLLAHRAGVSHSMAWKWMNGERVSQACAAAYAALTTRAPADMSRGERSPSPRITRRWSIGDPDNLCLSPWIRFSGGRFA